MTRYLVAGGAGFLGSHLVPRLLAEPDANVKVYDNLTSGTEEHLADVRGNERFELVVGDLKDLELLTKHLEGADHVYHLAANPDIARAVEEPSIDFWQGTYLTNNLIEACRENGVDRITYMSGSGVYGELGEEAAREDAGAMRPISTYGASKLACEVMLSAYCHMFGMHAVAFRFANVVGPRQTHGVTYDFVRKLLADPVRLQILGDGNQSKSYIHVSDVIDAMLLVEEQGWTGFEVYNVSTEDYTTVREIADMTVEALGLSGVGYDFTGGDRGWKGDVPVVRFDCSRIRERGWRNRLTSTEALADSIAANIAEVQAAAISEVGPPHTGQRAWSLATQADMLGIGRHQGRRHRTNRRIVDRQLDVAAAGGLRSHDDREVEAADRRRLRPGDRQAGAGRRLAEPVPVEDDRVRGVRLVDVERVLKRLHHRERALVEEEP